MSEPTNEGVRLLIVDDHALFREALAEMLRKEPDFLVVGTCATAAQAADVLAAMRPSMILLDFDLGSERVMDFIGSCQQQGYTGKILVVTAGVSGQEAIQLIQSGVRGIFHKHNTPDTLCHAIRQVASGEVFLEKAYLGPVFRTMDLSRATGVARLTERDKTVLRCLFEGLANKEIAGRLQVSEGAVKASISQLFHKLNVRTRAQLVKVALEQYQDQLG